VSAILYVDCNILRIEFCICILFSRKISCCKMYHMYCGVTLGLQSVCFVGAKLVSVEVLLKSITMKLFSKLNS
jgi:hypothetical protein